MTAASDDLGRFVDAQAPYLAQVEAELAAGRKRSHWMWFVFPQLRGLGRSEMARHYGLRDLAEARAYLDHPILGMRLRACVDLLLAIEGRTARDILGETDELKLRSCLTLFRAVDPDADVFQRALARFFDGSPDPLTSTLLAQQITDAAAPGAS